MSPKRKMIYANGKDNGLCPNCGNVMPTVEYYTAHPVKQEVIQQSVNTQKVITTYTDVNPHIGSICLICAHANQKSKRTLGMALLMVGGVGSFFSMMVGLILSRIAEASGGNVGAAMTPAMAFMVLLVIVAIVGLAVYLEGNRYKGSRAFDKDFLFSIFVLEMYKESKGVVYLSPLQVAQLKK